MADHRRNFLCDLGQSFRRGPDWGVVRKISVTPRAGCSCRGKPAGHGCMDPDARQIRPGDSPSWPSGFHRQPHSFFVAEIGDKANPAINSQQVIPIWVPWWLGPLWACWSQMCRLCLRAMCLLKDCQCAGFIASRRASFLPLVRGSSRARLGSGSRHRRPSMPPSDGIMKTVSCLDQPNGAYRAGSPPRKVTSDGTIQSAALFEAFAPVMRLASRAPRQDNASARSQTGRFEARPGHGCLTQH